MKRSLSVLLPVHNRQSTLAATVQEILELLPELTRHLEVVIIDDGSTDATIEVADELATLYPQVRVCRHAVHLGRAAAIGSGLDRSKGEIILVVDGDRRLPIERIQGRWQAMEEGGRVPWEPAAPAESKRSGANRWDAGSDVGFQMFHRRAAVCPASDRPASGSGRLKRPNYLSRLKDFALGE